MTLSFRTLSLCYVNLCSHVWFCSSREISHGQIKGGVMEDEIILDKKQIFVGFLVRSQVISLLEDVIISKREAKNVC